MFEMIFNVGFYFVVKTLCWTFLGEPKLIYFIFKGEFKEILKCFYEKWQWNGGQWNVLSCPCENPNFSLSLPPLEPGLVPGVLCGLWCSKFLPRVAKRLRNKPKQIKTLFHPNHRQLGEKTGKILGECGDYFLFWYCYNYYFLSWWPGLGVFKP